MISKSLSLLTVESCWPSLNTEHDQYFFRMCNIMHLSTLNSNCHSLSWPVNRSRSDCKVSLSFVVTGHQHHCLTVQIIFQSLQSLSFRIDRRLMVFAHWWLDPFLLLVFTYSIFKLIFNMIIWCLLELKIRPISMTKFSLSLKK